MLQNTAGGRLATSDLRDGSAREVYVREKDGEVFQIVVSNEGKWYYDVTTEE